MAKVHVGERTQVLNRLLVHHEKRIIASTGSLLNACTCLPTHTHSPGLASNQSRKACTNKPRLNSNGSLSVPTCSVERPMQRHPRLRVAQLSYARPNMSEHLLNSALF